MAELPRYDAAATPGAIGFSPRAVDTGQVGRATGGLAQSIRTFTRETQALEAARAKARQAAELMRVTAAATRELNDLQLELERDPDFATVPGRFDQGAKDIFGRWSEGLDPAVATAFDRDFTRLYEPKRVEIARGAFKGEIDAEVAGLDAILPEYVSRAANAKNQPERDAWLAQGRAAIAGLEAGGYIDSENAVARERKFMSGVSEAAARGLITHDPEAAIVALLDGAAFRGLDEVARARLTDMAAARAESVARERARRAEKADRDAEREAAAIGDERLKEAYALDADGALTRDHVDAIRGDISPAEYRSLLKMLDPASAGGGDDPDAFRDLQRTLIDNPGQAGDLALRYHGEGRIGNETLKSVLGNARTFDRQEGPKSEYERSRALLWNSLDPGAMVTDPIQRQRQAEAVALFDNYAGGAERSDEDLRKRGLEIRDQFTFVDLRETLIGLPNPRFGAVPRDGAKPDAVEAAIRDAEAETRRKYDAGEIDDGELAAEAEIFDRWRAWLDRARAGQAGGAQ